MVMEQIFLGLALVAICILALKFPRLISSKTPAKTAKAEVLSRKGEMSASMLPSQWGGRPSYQVSFLVEGETIVLNVDASQFTRLVENTLGTLSWRDNTMVSFLPDTQES